MELGSVSDSMLGGLRFGHPASVRHPDSLGVLNPVPCLQIPASFPQVSGGISIHWHGLYMWDKAAWYEGGGLGRGEWWEMRGQGGSRVRHRRGEAGCVTAGGKQGACVTTGKLEGIPTRSHPSPPNHNTRLPTNS